MNYSLEQAQKYLSEGKGKWLCHFSSEEDSDGISNPMPPEEWQGGGYVATYFTVEQLADPANWNEA